MRLTKIICTLGPSCSSSEKILALAQNGMNIARFNFSHGTQESHLASIRLVKEVANTHGMPLALMLDTKGAEIRTAEREDKLKIANNQEVIFASKEVPTDGRPLIIVNYDKFMDDVKKAERILVDNGALPFDIVEIRKDGAVIGRALDDGLIGSRRHINLPGADVSLPAMTEQDWSDLEFGIREEMDFIALSFIRTAEEVQEVTDFIKKKGSTMRVIAKIETRQSVANIDSIIDASDAIMVARGDLGAEMPFEKIPAVQDMIVAKCRAKAKPVIVATQMLESMIEYPMPTRAEVTDVAHAAVTRADATMLSGETAAGQHPIGAISAMRTILQETESHLSPETNHPVCFLGERQAIADAAVTMALSMQAQAIIVLTRSGSTAQAVSMFRSGLPIIAVTDTPATERALQIVHGVQTLGISFEKDPELTVEKAFAAIRERHIIESGKKIVVISDSTTKSGIVRAVHLRTLS